MDRKPKQIEFHFDQHSLVDPAELWTFGKPADNQPVKCICGWLGTIGQTREERVRSDPQSWAQLAGRDGWDYCCPVCGMVITSFYFGMS